MNLTFHGGKCCGIKTIWGLGQLKSEIAPALAKINQDNADQYGHSINTEKRFFTDAAPEETYDKRLDRYIEFCRTRRPQHIIEITLADGLHIKQTKTWGKHLEKLGFKKVTEAKNSNSGNTVSIWHLTYNVPEEQKQAQQAAINAAAMAASQELTAA